MKIGKAKVGMYVSVNELAGATVFQIKTINGPLVEVAEIRNGQPLLIQGRQVEAVHDISIFEPATRVQLVNAGVQQVPTVQGDPVCCPFCESGEVVFNSCHSFEENGETWDLDRYDCRSCEREFFV